jgi:hypothetical protein
LIKIKDMCSRSKVIEQAIEKAESSGPQSVDIHVTSFRKAYFRLLREAQINAEMNEPKGVYEGEIWFRIRSALLRDGAYIHHKSDRGFVDLTFPDTDANLLEDLRPFLQPGMATKQTGKSAAIRLEVPKVESFADFKAEEGKVQQALNAVSQLLAFYNKERAQIESVLSRAHRPKGLLNA